MGLFFKKKEKSSDITIYAPINGQIKPIEKLQDQTFANKVMGDGIAIIPTEGKVYAPIDGKISALLDTKHAYGISGDNGVELLIHIGQDTVNLKGQHFETNKKEGDVIKKGDLLGTFNIAEIIKAGYNVATPVILIAGGEYHIKEKTSANTVAVGDVLFTISK